MGYPLNKEATIESYLHYIRLQLLAERERTETHVISDRSLVDLLAYSRTKMEPLIPPAFVAMVDELLYIESRYFDVYCYLPIQFDLVLDDVRPADIEYQKTVGDNILLILDEYKLPYVEISGTLEERCAKVVEMVRTTSRN